MMMLPERNKVVSVILERLGASPSYSEKKEGETSDKDIALKDAMGKFLKAIKSEDVDAMTDYLKEFIYMCDEDGTESKEEIGE